MPAAVPGTEERRTSNFYFRQVSDAWVQDGEFHILVDMSKLGPGTMFSKGLTYAQCINATRGGGISNPCPDLASATAPAWWTENVPGAPWMGYVLVDMKDAGLFQKWFIFAPNNIAQKNLPPSVEFQKETEEVWPAVLVGRGFLDVKNIVSSSGNLTSTVAGFYYQEQISANCKVRVRQWFTTTPWVYGKTLKLPIDVKAEARQIFFSYPNGSTLRLMCLHDHILTSSLSISSVNGQAASAVIPMRDFPRTRITTWIPQKRNEIKEVDGRWFREELTIYFPFNPLDKAQLPRNSSS